MSNPNDLSILNRPTKIVEVSWSVTPRVLGRIFVLTLGNRGLVTINLTAKSITILGFGRAKMEFAFDSASVNKDHYHGDDKKVTKVALCLGDGGRSIWLRGTARVYFYDTSGEVEDDPEALESKVREIHSVVQAALCK